MEKDLVSVIVPTYNSEKFLFQCLESIKKQTYKNTELIIVDNNSADNTKEIALSFCHSREDGLPAGEAGNLVQVFNKGPERSAQVNFGVKHARGGEGKILNQVEGYKIESL